MAVFATFPSSDLIGYKKVLLSFSPINNEDSLSARAHLEYMEYVLEMYGKSWANVAALVGDNCNVNGAFAIYLDVHWMVALAIVLPFM